MTKRKRYLLCGHGESLPMAEDGATSLSSVLEELAVEVCAEAVSARRRVNEEHFDFVWVSCCEGAEPINLAAACKRDSPQTAVYLVTADRTGSVTSRAQAAELDGIVSPAELGEHLLATGAIGNPSRWRYPTAKASDKLSRRQKRRKRIARAFC